MVSTVPGPDEAARADVLIRRTATGWRVEGLHSRSWEEPFDDLGTAMVLADLLAGETRPGPRPRRPTESLDEIAELRLTVAQLKHALTARVVVERAIGVLAERWHVQPLLAFDRMRGVARSRGWRVHDLAKEVVASTTDRDVDLPDDLTAPPRTPPPAPDRAPPPD